MKKLSILFFAVLFIVCIAVQAFAAVSSINNNFTMINGTGGLTGGTNDVVFTWDGTMKTSVAVSGQVSNATLSSVTPFFGVPWQAHDVAIYGPGIYTIFADCPAGSPGCGAGTPVTFTVGTNQLGVHMLFDWGGSYDIDVVDIWVPNATFGPSPMYIGGTLGSGGFNYPSTVWSWMSSDWNGDGMNGYPMVDGPFIGFNANFNVNYIGTINNNFTMITSGGGIAGGDNSFVFNWNGTKKTSVAASGQVSNATLFYIDPFYGNTYDVHDMAIYGPGTYTVYADCPAGSPGCGLGTPVTFSVASNQLGAHMLFDWGGSYDIDVVDIWVPNAVFGPSPIYTGPDGGTVDPVKVWDWMSSDWNGDGMNGYGMVDGPFAGFNANFNVMGVPSIVVDPCADAATRCNDNNACTTDTCNTATGVCTHPVKNCNDNNACTIDSCNTSTGACVHTTIICNDNKLCTDDSCDTMKGCVFTPNTLPCPIGSTNNNFTMVDPSGKTIGGTNDVEFYWDGTRKTSVAVYGQVTSALITSTCAFQGQTWSAHDVAIYGPGTYTVYAGCAAGSPGCGLGTAMTFTVGSNQLGAHMLFDWGVSKNIDVVNVWNQKVAFAPSPLWTGACGSQAATKVWDLMSSDFDGDGINGKKMVDGPFLGFNANFNLILPPTLCGCCISPSICDDNNACTTETCTTATGMCSSTPIVCNDNNACTTDTCNTATGCVFTPINCNDNNACTTDSCNPASGCVFTPIVCNDNNACTTKTCNTTTGCVFTPFNCCDDNNVCTVDDGNPATGCIHTPTVPASCNDNNACTTDGCANNACTHTVINCNDNNACTADSCNPAIGCVHTPVICPSYPCSTDTGCNPLTGCPPEPLPCNDNNACTIDTCNSATGCVFTPINCNDNNACTTDTCNTATGCIHTPINCNDNNLCTTDTCNTATGCVFTPLACPTCSICDPTSGVCLIATCVPADCNDNNACTVDSCSCGGCFHTFLDCNDNNACTADSCNPATGCVHTPIVCNDNNCNTIDSCNTATGACVYTPNPLACDDNNPCTIDSCSPVTGACVHIIMDCNDNNACTDDVCVNGICSWRDNCPAGSACNRTTGACMAGVCYTDQNCGNPAFYCSRAAGNCGGVFQLGFLYYRSWEGPGAAIDSFNVTIKVIHSNSTLHVIDKSMNGQVVEVNVGDTIDVRLKGNPTTGYEWKYVSSNSLPLKEAIFTPDQPMITGSGGTYDFVFSPNGDDGGGDGTCKIKPDPNTCPVYIVEPVHACGCDGRTYYDACRAAAAGVNVAFDGTCECGPNGCIPNNNFTMIDPTNNAFGGTNDVMFAWDGTKKTSVAAIGQVSNALITSTCQFFGVTWAAHDVNVYGPGTYTIYSGCAAGSPGCGTGAPITFSVNAGEIGIHMLFDWNGALNIDVVNVMKPKAVSSNMWTGACGTNAVGTVWQWASYDFNGDGINGTPMVDGPFVGMNANFNLIKIQNPCSDAATRCNDNIGCTLDTCDSATGACVHTPNATACDDHNLCTKDTCDTATGCKNEVAVWCYVGECNPLTGQCWEPCNDNNLCTNDFNDPVTGCIHLPVVCNDNNACTADTCDPATGCVYTPIVCNDNNKCTIDSCNTATGCVFTPIVCDDNNKCTIDACNPATGACVFTPVVCNDNNKCTVDACDTATGLCVYTPVVCNDNSFCTTDTCDPVTGCVFTPITCDDGNACTTDSCNASTGCIHAAKICNDGNECTADTCNTTTGACVYTAVANGTICSSIACPLGGATCTSGVCVASCTCPKGSYKSVTLKGTGSSYWWYEKQIMTQFTVSGSGCILRYTASTLTATPGTVLKANWKVGIGPNPTSVTWKGVSVPAKTVPYTITCPSSTGTVGNLVLSNTSARHGKDSDTLTISTATK